MGLTWKPSRPQQLPPIEDVTLVYTAADGWQVHCLTEQEKLAVQACDIEALMTATPERLEAINEAWRIAQGYQPRGQHAHQGRSAEDVLAMQRPAAPLELLRSERQAREAELSVQGVRQTAGRDSATKSALRLCSSSAAEADVDVQADRRSG
jgi:hypothetical protein